MNRITQWKKTREGFTSRLDEAEERISELKEKAGELPQSEQQVGKKKIKSEDSLRDLWDNIKLTNILLTNILPPRRKEKTGQKSHLKKRTAENIPNLEVQIDIQIQEAQSSKSEKPKETLKAAREK